VVVVRVEENSPAAQAGLNRGMVVLALDEEPLEDTADYQSRLGSLAQDQKVKMWLLEKGKRSTLVVVARRYPMERAKELVWQRLGLELGPMDALAAQRNRVPEGQALMVTKVRSSSKAQRAGLQPGDLVRRMGRDPVADLDEFYLDMVRSRHQPKVAILFQRGRAQQVITFGR